jgi:predicted enzyme related to lactoylglutathione lyase
MNPIVHFEIPADNELRAKKFYEKLFGWKIKKYEMPGDVYWMI